MRIAMRPVTRDRLLTWLLLTVLAFMSLRYAYLHAVLGVPIESHGPKMP